MAFEGVVAGYKLQPVWKRLLLMTFLSGLPAAWQMYDEGQILQEDLAEAQDLKNRAEKKFKAARVEKANLPALEEKLAYTEGQLAVASKKLPDEFIMEKILQKVSIIAQDVGIDLRVFDPGEGVPTGGLFKYVQLPIDLQVFGTYGQIATFFDRIVHLDLLVHIKNVKLELSSLPEDDNQTEGADRQLTVDTRQKKARERSRLLGSAEMVVFRTLSLQEEAAITAVEEKENKKKKKKKKKKTKKA